MKRLSREAARKRREGYKKHLHNVHAHGGEMAALKRKIACTITGHSDPFHHKDEFPQEIWDRIEEEFFKESRILFSKRQ